MKKFLFHSKELLSLISLLVIVPWFSHAQTITIDANPGQSGNIVIGPNNYHVSENIYGENEIGATNFLTAATAINHIDLSVFAVGTNTLVDSFRVYLKEIPLSATTLSAGVYDTAGYTKVFDGTVNFNATGWIGFDLTTPFVRTSGQSLQLLIERRDSVIHTGFSFNSSRGNGGDPSVVSSRRVNLFNAPVPGSSVLATASAFRPAIQFRHINANDARISQVYTLGKLPIPFAVPHVISTTIVNGGTSAITNLPVTLSISGSNTFSDVQTVTSLAAGDTVIVSFAAFTPSTAGSNMVEVSIPADDFNADNTFSVDQEVTTNAYNYASGTVATGATGFNIIVPTNPSGTGDFSALFTTSSPTSVNQVGVRFITGGQPFNVVIWDKSGSGTPGAVLWESTTQTSTAGIFTMPVSPAVPVTDSFYVGIRQTAATNIQFAYQSENPARPNTFFYAQPSGNTNWTDLAPTSPFRFMIEPRLTLANDVGIATITNPSASTTIDNCGITPQVIVSNFGSANQTAPFDVTYTIRQGGVTVYSDTRSLTLNSGLSSVVEFNNFPGSITGADSSIVFTSLATDAATNNDTVVNTFNTGVYSYSDSTPSSGGYAFANSTICAIPSPIRPTYNWITNTSNEVDWGASGDDTVLATPIAIPFPFRFFGNTYTQFWIASNGWISFTQPALTAVAQRTPVPIPSAAGPSNYIAGLLANLDLTTSTYPDAHTYYGGDASQMTITYFHAHLFGSATAYITFQIVLKTNGDVLVQFNDAESTTPIPAGITNSSLTGIENSDGTAGLQYRLNGSGGSVFGSPLAVLFVAPLTALPAGLTHFTAQRNGRVNKLNWATAQELNTSYFAVERSTTGSQFSVIGRITAAGNSSRTLQYGFVDNRPVKGINYYRLAITDVNGTVKYSAVKAIRNAGTADATLFPVPVKNSVNLVINSDATDKGTVSITNLSGQLIQQQQIQLASGQNQISVNTSTLSSGAYVMKITLQADVIVKKFNKQ